MFQLTSLFSALDRTAVPTAAEIHAAIDRGELARANAIAALEEIGRSRRELLLRDDDAGLDRADSAEEAHLRVIAKIDAALPELNARLAAARHLERGDAMARHRARLAGAVGVLRSAVREALTANLAVEKIVNDARRELGAGAADQAVPNCRFAGFLTKEGVDYWETFATKLLAVPWHAPAPTEPVAPPPAEPVAPPPPPEQDGRIKVIVGQNGWRNGQFEFWDPGATVMLPAHWARQLIRAGHVSYAAHSENRPDGAAIKPGERMAPATARPARPPLPAAPPAGFVRVTVLVSGYCDHDGRPCSRGDHCDVPIETARVASMNGAVEILPAAIPAEPAAPAEPPPIDPVSKAPEPPDAPPPRPKRGRAAQPETEE